MQSSLDLADWWSMGLGLGLLPMSGTMGSLLGFPLIFLMSRWSFWWALLFFTIIVLASWKACLLTYQRLGGVDHSAIVSDEIVGMLFAFIFVPLNLNTVLVGFLCFRLLDIFKPWPICLLDRQSTWRGHEVMLDDVLAGVITNIILQSYFYSAQWTGLIL